MNKLWLYESISKFVRVKYSHKIMLAAFVGTHIPLLSLIAYFVFRYAPSREVAIPILVVALVATLAGTAATLYVLSELLKPVLMTAQGLRVYAETGKLPELPTEYQDEVGVLMGDAAKVLFQLDKSIYRSTHYDEATGLPKRPLFSQQLDENSVSGKPYAVCVLVIRNFEVLLAAYGQSAPVAVMKAVAGHLLSSVGSAGRVSRLGSNVFAFSMGDRATGSVGHDGLDSIQLVLDKLPRSYDAHGKEIYLQISAGVSSFPGDGKYAESLLNSAFLAASADHADGEFNIRSDLAVYSPVSRMALLKRLDLESGLRHAVARGELSVNYQPIIDLNEKKVVGMEALMRWTSPQHGAVSPAEFIPIAESAGFIQDLSRWMLDAACRQLKAWTGTDLESLYITVNMSASEFLADDLLQTVDHALALAGVSPDRLQIEFTESVAMSDTLRTRNTLVGLGERGIRTAIDDFGTGYSSMAYLQNLPVSKLKIDRSFVDHVDGSRANGAICRSMVEISSGLDLAVVAEGVERREEIAFLLSLGCHRFQGYYFARPLLADKVVETLGSADFLARVASFDDRTNFKAQVG